MTTYIINPLTNRNIKVDSVTYKKLVKDGVIKHGKSRTSPSLSPTSLSPGKPIDLKNINKKLEEILVKSSNLEKETFRTMREKLEKIFNQDLKEYKIEIKKTIKEYLNKSDTEKFEISRKVMKRINKKIKKKNKKIKKKDDKIKKKIKKLEN